MPETIDDVLAAVNEKMAEAKPGKKKKPAAKKESEPEVMEPEVIEPSEQFVDLLSRAFYATGSAVVGALELDTPFMPEQADILADAWAPVIAEIGEPSPLVGALMATAMVSLPYVIEYQQKRKPINENGQSQRFDSGPAGRGENNASALPIGPNATGIDY